MSAASETLPGDDSSASFAHPCLPFLNDDSTKHISWCIQSTALRGLVVVATEAIPPNTVLFDLPQSRVLSYQRDVCSTPLSKYLFGLFADDDRPTISPEELTWLNMIVWLNQSDADANNYCHIYLKALDPVPPVLSSWPRPLQDLLIGTNIQTQNQDGTTTKCAAVAVDLLLALLERVRMSIREKEMKEQAKDRTAASHTTCPPIKNYADKNYADKSTEVQARNLLMQHAPHSMFTKSSILWARGHFMSRRFPDTLLVSSADTKTPPHTNIATAIDTTSNTTTTAKTIHQQSFCFLPVLDLMNHSALQANSCKVTSHTTNQRHFLQVTSGELPMDKGDEFFYSYGSTLSNEVLLQAYGFCLPDNPADTVSVRITPNHQGSTTKDATSYVGVIGRGGVSAIPAALWKALATKKPANSAAKEDEVEIGSGDLELLREYFTDLLKTLMLTMNDDTTTSTDAAGEKRKRSTDDDDQEATSSVLTIARTTTTTTTTTTKPPPLKTATNATGSCAVETERRRYIHFYKQGQREILEELVRDLSLYLSPGATVP